MEASEWAAVSAVAAAISATVSAGAAVVALLNVRTQQRAADARDCLEFVKQFGEAQRKANGVSGEELEREVLEVLNLLETAALLFNDSRLGRSSAQIVRHALVESWVWLNTTDGMAEILERAITGPTTFQQLLNFKLQFARDIDLLAKKRNEAATGATHLVS